MKRNRNSFFTETNTQTGFINPNNMSMPIEYSNSYYYGGPVPNNYNILNNELESKIAKMERQIAKLEHRVSKLENELNIKITEKENNYYIV